MGWSGYSVNSFEPLNQTKENCVVCCASIKVFAVFVVVSKSTS